MAFETHLTEAGAFLVLALQGELDTRAAPKLEKTLDELLSSERKVLVADCARLDFLTSAGLRVLLVAGKRLAGQGGQLLLSGLNPSVREVFEISGFASLFQVFPTRESALEWVASHGSRAQLSHLAEELIGRSEGAVRHPPPPSSALSRERAALAAQILLRSRGGASR